MAFGVKYRTEIADMYGIVWRTDFLWDAYAGAVTDLKSSGDPLNFEFDSDSDDLCDPIKPTKAIIKVIAYTDFVLSEFYAVEDMEIKVNIYQNTSTLYFSGYVQPQQYTESYDCTPYEVQITAIDGLNFLKNILFTDVGPYLVKRQLQSALILDILGELGFTTFTEFVNLYEANMSDATTDSPFDQTYIDVTLFEDNEMYCYDVLAEMLKPYLAVIKQINGVFTIYRPTELLESTVYGRIFTGDTTKSGTSISPDQYINRTTSASDIRQRPGGALMIQAPVKKIYLNHDYGSKESWVDNYQFKGDTYDDTTGTYEHWTNGGAGLNHIGELIPGEKDGIAIPASASTPIAGFSVYQSVGWYAKTSGTDTIGLEFEYLLYNFSGADISNVVVYLGVKSYTSNQWLYDVDDNFLGWKNTIDYIKVTIANVAVGSSGWLSYKKNVTGLPTDGTYTVTFYGAYTPGSLALYCGLKDLKLFASSTAIVMKKVEVGFVPVKQGGWITRFQKRFVMTPVYSVQPQNELTNVIRKTYEVTNAINGKELSYDFILGDVTDADIDNVTEQFKGSLAVYSSGEYKYTTSWHSRGGAQNDPILELIGAEIGVLYERPRHFIQMALWEKTADAVALDMLANFQDVLNTYSGNIRTFAMNRGSFDVKNRFWDIDLIEIGTKSGVIYTGNGLLYNWYAASYELGLELNLIAPSGWRVPTKSDFETLQTYLGANAGGQLKDTGSSWDSPNTGATNGSGFTAYCANIRLDDGTFSSDLGQEGEITVFWASTEDGEGYADILQLEYNSADMNIATSTNPGEGDDPKNNAASIRLIKNDSTDPGSVEDYDGNVYATIKIGTQVWMKTNLAVTHYRNGTAIPEVEDNTAWNALDSGAYCWYDNIPSGNIATADSTTVTADSSIITVDSQ
jgi:uncharacterized protein (TIGR02145 family)